VDIIIPLLIAAMVWACLAKTVSSAFRTINITGLPVAHNYLFAR
jgi:uncharacterized membrane protein YccF (DUF307 family)